MGANGTGLLVSARNLNTVSANRKFIFLQVGGDHGMSPETSVSPMKTNEGNKVKCNREGPENAKREKQGRNCTTISSGWE